MDTKTRSRRTLSLLVVVGLISLVIAPASGFDSTPPSLDSATISPSQISDSGGNVTVTLKITSNTGLANPPVIVISLVGDIGRQLAFGSVPLTSGDSKIGTYSKQFQIASNQMPGNYQVVVYPLTDTSQNSTGTFIFTNSHLIYGNVSSATPAPTPTPSPTHSSTPSPIASPTSNPADLITISRLSSSVDSLNSTIDTLKASLILAQSDLATWTAQKKIVSDQLKTVSTCLAAAKKIISSKKGKLPSGC